MAPYSYITRLRHFDYSLSRVRDTSLIVAVALALPIAIHTAPAAAIVDVQDEFYANPESNAFTAVSFDFEGDSGNQEQSEMALEVHSVLRRGNSTWLFIGAAELDKTDDVKTDDNRFFHLRYVRQVKQPHGFEIMAQQSRDEFDSLDRRTVYGGSYRYEWQPAVDGRHGALGLGVIREHERYTENTPGQRVWRANVYSTLARPVHFLDDGEVGLTLYGQPALNDPGDLRAIGVLSLEARLSSRLSIGVACNVPASLREMIPI